MSIRSHGGCDRDVNNGGNPPMEERMTIESLAALVEREFENVPKSFLEHLKGAERGAHHLTSLPIGEDRRYPNTVPDVGQVFVGLAYGEQLGLISKGSAIELIVPLMETALNLWDGGAGEKSFVAFRIAESGGDREVLYKGLRLCQRAWEVAKEDIKNAKIEWIYDDEDGRADAIVTSDSKSPRFWQVCRSWAGKNLVRVIAVIIDGKNETKVLSNGNEISCLDNVGATTHGPYEADVPASVPIKTIVSAIEKMLTTPASEPTRNGLTFNPFAALAKK